MIENKIMDISEIKIPNYFKNPKFYKFKECMDKFKKTGETGKEILIDKNNVLKDGYIAYLTLKNNDVKKCEVKVISEKTIIYVYGKHDGNNKVYVWKITNDTKDIENLKPGNHALVRTKFGISYVLITRIEAKERDRMPEKVKAVVRCFSE